MRYRGIKITLKRHKMQPFNVFNHLIQKRSYIMKNQSKFRLLTLAGVFSLLTISLSSCFYGGYDRYYSRPAYGYGYRPYVRPQTRVYVVQPKLYYKQNGHHRNYGSNGHHRNYRGGNSRNGRR